MRKLTLLLMLLVVAQNLKGQNLSFQIKGILLQNNNFKYAYLLDNKDIMPLMATVADNKFEFTVYKGDKFDLRTLCLTTDSIDRTAFVLERKGFGIRNSRLIAMEDLTIEIGFDLPSAVVKGGPPNIEVDEMFKALRTKDVAGFFHEHSDSPISLLLLRSLIRLNEISSDFNYQCSSYYDVLSERLRETSEGKKVREMLSK